MSLHVPSLLVVLAASVAAPLIGELTRRFGLSIVVLELALGVAIGPQGLGWASVEGAVPAVASIGMAFLFFLAGLEIELGAVRGRPIMIAFAGWIACIAASLAMAFAAHRLGMFNAWIVVGLALSTTALGVLVPILRDCGRLDSTFGRHALAVGAVGELGPILLMSFLLSRQHDTALQSVLVMVFLAIVLVLAWALVRGVADPPALRLLRRTLTQASQLPVRGVILLCCFRSSLPDCWAPARGRVGRRTPTTTDFSGGRWRQIGSKSPQLSDRHHFKRSLLGIAQFGDGFEARTGADPTNNVGPYQRRFNSRREALWRTVSVGLGVPQPVGSPRSNGRLLEGRQACEGRSKTRAPAGFSAQTLHLGCARSEAFDPPGYTSGDRRYASAQRSEQNHGPVGVVLRYAA